MLTGFYQRYSWPLLLGALLTLPFLIWQANQLPANNDIETWLPGESPVRVRYEQFKHDFGVDEVIVVALTSPIPDHELLEPLACRIEQLPGIRKAWTPDRFREVMTGFSVTPDEADHRLRGLVLGEKSSTIGIVAVLNEEGLQKRAQLVEAVRNTLSYCQLTSAEVALTGAPVVVSELDQLGSQNSNRRFFMISLLLSLILLYYSTRHWGLSLSLLGLTIWGINLTLAVIYWTGGEMNFILNSLPILVMIFTLSISIHLLSYYSTALEEGSEDPLAAAMWQSWKPCLLSTVTTLIGLFSLNVSSIRPVQDFGLAAACGSVVALLVGLGFTPTLLILWPRTMIQSAQHELIFRRWGLFVIQHHRKILAGAVCAMLVLGAGLLRLESHIDPVSFLPQHNRVVRDLRQIESTLTNVDGLEVVVDFGASDLPFLERVERIRELELRLRSHPAVRHTMSLASFFPSQMPGGAFEVMQILRQAQSRTGDQEFLADGDRKWRISTRLNLHAGTGYTQTQLLSEFKALTAGANVEFTGVYPLLESAQTEIFSGFWESFTSAFLIISLVMIISLRSLRTGMIAMVPNLIPIWLVFGIVGYCGMNVDIGMMMTGSIALGISVDCTFHFLVRFREHRERGESVEESTLEALAHTGWPVVDSAIVGSLGMLALTLSNFAPTARFGCLMAAQTVASVLGELMLLPALLCFRVFPSREQASGLPLDPAPEPEPEPTLEHHERTERNHLRKPPFHRPEEYMDQVA